MEFISWGGTRFLTVLGGEPALADALVDLCLSLTTSYTEFLLEIPPVPFEGLCGFGRDATLFPSPTLYQRYSADWNARLFECVCRRHQLPATMPGNVGRLRQSLPETELELTLHPPEFDLATAEPVTICEVLRGSARTEGGRNVHCALIVAVHRPEDLPRVGRNLQVCVDTLEELRGEWGG